MKSLDDHYNEACDCMARMAKAARRRYPRGSGVIYTIGEHDVRAVVEQHGEQFGLNVPKVRVVGMTGRVYWLDVTRIVSRF